MRRDNVVEKLTALGERLAVRLQQAFNRRELPYFSQHFGSLVTPILVPRQKVLRNYAEVQLQDMHTSIVSFSRAVLHSRR
ncbi:MAG: hypothetical protein CBARDCOR_4004 [uncultured Caballeronia sp.]|nr:MAG: hypothetical protein CBARDCOR_4004 [uncultured Caballeronia sp.]